MDYLALLILLPLSLNVALAAEAILASEKIMLHISSIIPTAWIAAFFIKLVPFVFIITTLMVMYLFFPHVKVKTGAALTGAIFAAVFWFFFQNMYIALQVGVANYNAIYGSFASIPLFLIWLQIGWTFILLGASLAYAIQHHRHYHSTEGTLSPQRRLQVAFDILHAVYENFEQRRPASLSQLSVNLPHTRCADIAAVAHQLMTGRLLRQVDTPHEETFLPVTSAEKLSASEVVRLILGAEDLPSAGGQRATLAVEAASSALNTDFASPLPTEQS
jgi:membrane protein